MAFNTIALMLGYRCNARCRSCLWGGNGSPRPELEVEEACGWVDQACQASDLKLIGFSGGESFLYRNEMLAIAAHAHRQHGLWSAASTNSYWAFSEAEAERALQPLHAVGLRQLLLSVDDFHQEFIPLERVGNALRAAQRMGIVCTVQTVITNSSRRLADYLTALGIKAGDEVRATEVFCTRIGWAATRIPADEFPPKPGALSSYCSMLQPLIIMPNGAVHLCCGPAFAIPALTLGNLKTEPLKEILDRAEWDPLLNALSLGNGPAVLADCLREGGDGELLRPGYSSSCEACYHLLTTPGVETTIRERLEPQRAELFFKRNLLFQESRDSLLTMLRL